MTKLTTAERSARYRSKDVQAYRERKASYARTPEQREKRTEYMQRWREENRERHNQTKRESSARLKLSRTPEERHDLHLRTWYGMSRAEYLAMLEGQGGGCAICGATEAGAGKSFHVDHCHETNKIRGLLCNRCNTHLGWYERAEIEVQAYLSADYGDSKEVRNPAIKAASRRNVEK